MNVNKLLVGLFIVAFVLLLLPYFFRFAQGNTVFIGSEPHYHARIASFIRDNGMPEKDVFSDKKYLFNPYHFVLAGAGFIIPIEIASIIVPVMLGLLSLLFFYLVLRSFKFNSQRSFFILFIFVFSPFFVSIFSLSTPRALALVLLFLGFYLFQKKSSVSFLFSLIILGIASLCGFVHAVMILIILLVYSFCMKKRFIRFYFAFTVVFLVFLFVYLPYYLFTGGFGLVLKSDLISEFGAIYGFGVFSLLLGIFGLFLVWIYKKRFYAAYIAGLCIVISSFFVNDILVYANIIVCFFAGSAFYSLYVREWELSDLRSFALLVIFCGLLFSVVSNAAVLGRMPPKNEFIDCLDWIGLNTPQSSYVFAHPADGFFIEFWSERPVLVDEFKVNKNLEDDFDLVWNSVDIKSTQDVLSRYSINYILIHEDLFSGLVWDKKDQGLDLLLKNPETFKRRYANSYCEVWEFKGS